MFYFKLPAKGLNFPKQPNCEAIKNHENSPKYPKISPKKNHKTETENEIPFFSTKSF